MIVRVGQVIVRVGQVIVGVGQGDSEGGAG